MINKKNLWFLTLFSLVLVLSIYYVTMPNEVFDKDLSNKESETTSTEIKESSVVSDSLFDKSLSNTSLGIVT